MSVLTQVQRQMVGEYDEAEQRLRETTKQLFDGGLRWEELPTEWAGALSLGLASLQSLSVEKGLPKALQQKLDHSSNDFERAHRSRPRITTATATDGEAIGRAFT